MESSDSDDIFDPREGLRKQVHMQCDESIAPTCSSYLSKKSQRLKSKLSLSQRQRQADFSLRKEESSFLQEESSNSQTRMHVKSIKTPTISLKKSRDTDTLFLSSSSDEETKISQSKVKKRIVRRSDLSSTNVSLVAEAASPYNPSATHPIHQSSPIKCDKGTRCESTSIAHRNAYIHKSDSVESSSKSSVISLNFPQISSNHKDIHESAQSPVTFLASGETKEDFVQHWVDSLEIGETEQIAHPSDEDTQPLILPTTLPSENKLNHLESKQAAAKTYSSHDNEAQLLLISKQRDSDVSTNIPSSIDDPEKKNTPKKDSAGKKTPLRGMVTPRRNKKLSVDPSSSSGKQTSITAYYTPVSKTPEKPIQTSDIVSQVHKNTSINELCTVVMEEEMEVDTVIFEEVESAASTNTNPVESAKDKWSYIMSRMGMRGNATNLQREIAQAKNQKMKEPKQRLNSTNGQEAGPSNNTERQCPFYKRIPGTGFAIDAFCYGRVKGVSSYFLSHFHYDHYRGLGKWLDKPLYCSQVTANLVNMKIRPNPHLIKVLPLNESVVIEHVEVILIDANHCPGSVMFLFKFPTGKAVLHVGDFRAHPSMEMLKELKQQPINELYLDTTYCDEHYELPSQEEVLAYIRRLVRRYSNKHEKLLIVSGTYTIGKEKVFMTAAEELDSKVWAPTEKRRVLNCLDDLNICGRLAKDPLEARVHVVNMSDIKPANLKKYLDNLKGTFTHILALNPTGWEFDSQTAVKGLDSIQPKVYHGAIFIHGVPYSEHSGFSEMKRFVRHFKPSKIIPTVNMGSAVQRQKMEAIFTNWLGHPAR